MINMSNMVCVITGGHITIMLTLARVGHKILCHTMAYVCIRHVTDLTCNSYQILKKNLGENVGYTILSVNLNLG